MINFTLESIGIDGIYPIAESSTELVFELNQLQYRITYNEHSSMSYELEIKFNFDCYTKSIKLNLMYESFNDLIQDIQNKHNTFFLPYFKQQFTNFRMMEAQYYQSLN